MTQESEQTTATSAGGGSDAPVDATAAAEGAETTQAFLDAAQAEVARLKEERLRALAEAENTRRRAARDRQEASQYAIANFARDLLSVADNLERALASVGSEARQADAQLDALVGGVEATLRELTSALDRHGVHQIPAMGAQFDPHLHEAMFEVPDETVPHGTIVHVLQPGYQLHNRTLRAARVGTSRGGAKPAVSAATEAAENVAAGAEKVVFGESAGGGGASDAYTESDAGMPGSRIDKRT